MGTDIHGIFQKKVVTPEAPNGVWEDILTTYDEGRHYLLFAWLGNVRNGFGFAGVPTHEAIVPLSDGRGYPEDFQVDADDNHRIAANEFRGPCRAEYYTDEDLDVSNVDRLQMWMGDHSYSWVSGTEVLEATLPKIRRTGIIYLDTYKQWDGISAPEDWCGGVTGPKVVVSTPDNITTATSHVQIEWTEDTSASLKYFLDEVRRLVELHGEIRFVFGFDS